MRIPIWIFILFSITMFFIGYCAGAACAAIADEYGNDKIRIYKQ